MEKYTNEELLEVLPSSVKETKELTSKQKVVLGQLCVYNGLEIAKKDGYFYRSNKDLCDDCDIKSEHTLIAATRKLEMLGFIDRKKGSRGSGASEYRINEKLIGDYCKTNTANCSDNCSVKLAEMSNRIKELENTVKRLVERITVIEGKNYSTESEIDKELDKEKELNNKKNKNSLYNNIDETENTKELEIAESEKDFIESELEIASSPSEVETSNEEQTFIPTAKDKEELKRWNELVNPYLLKVQSATSNAELNTIQSKLIQAVNDKYDEWGYPNESVSTYLNERISEYFTSRVKNIEDMHSEQITKQLEQMNRYASYY